MTVWWQVHWAWRRRRFALEFHPHNVAIASRAPAAPLLSHLSGGLHEARGTITFCSDRAWVVDFGVPAFQEGRPPRKAKLGRSVSGRFYIGVDPFFYFERLKNEKGMPNLFRHWVIRRIFLGAPPR
ncbi:MAG: hypothetical protein GEV06_25045 [Luteitalea sp.]|nr:hypothetical protein [Luteitalea sp.]